MIDYNKLTPIETYNKMMFKRDDLFIPFGKNNVNGGKLRQCFALLDDKNINGVMTGCGIHSPQSAIVSSVANYLDLPCIVVIGGTNENRISEINTLNLAKSFGAEIKIVSSGRHTVLYKNIRDLQRENGYFIVNYGINIKDNSDAIINSTSNQVKNLPDYLDNLFITCGSGITSIGILLGLHLFKKRVKNIHLIGNAPNREVSIKNTLINLSEELQDKTIADIKFQYHDMFNTKGFRYEKKEFATLNNIILHPNYEAKAWKYIHDNNLVDYNLKNLFWIVGSDIAI